MEVNTTKKRKKNNQAKEHEVEEILQYNHAIPIPETHLNLIDFREEAGILQKVFSLFKFQKQQNVRLLPKMDNDETEVIHKNFMHIIHLLFISKLINKFVCWN